MDRSLGILNVRHESGGNPTGIGDDGDDVVEDAHEGHGRESNSVQDPRRGGEAEPDVNENEDGGKVYVSNGGGDNEDGERESAVARHIGRGVGGTDVETTASPETGMEKEEEGVEGRGGFAGWWAFSLFPFDLRYSLSLGLFLSSFPCSIQSLIENYKINVLGRWPRRSELSC